MAKIEHANGHRLKNLSRMLPPAVSPAARPRPEDFEFDLERALGAILSLRAEIPEDAYTARTLGTEREGNGVLIGDNGLVLTIGHLVNEAKNVQLGSQAGKTADGRLIAYDHATGFGLVRALSDLGVPPLELGDPATLTTNDAVVVGGHGGIKHAVAARLVSKREFAGYWEYVLDEALFTAPPHPLWGGAGLIGRDGRLHGIGSLFVQDALPGRRLHGNMFVPVSILKPIFHDLLTIGRSTRPPRPWLGMFSTEQGDQIVVAGLSQGGPAQQANVSVGDVIAAVDGDPVSTLSDLWRKIWQLGEAGTVVPLTLLRDGDPIEVAVRSASRYDFLSMPRRH